MEATELVLVEVVQLGEHSVCVRLMNDATLEISFGKEQATLSADATRRIALAAAQLQVKRLVKHLGARAEDIRSAARGMPLAEFDRAVSERIGGGGGFQTEETAEQLGARVHSHNVVARLESMGLDQWDAWDTLRYGAEKCWQAWQRRHEVGFSALEQAFTVLRNALERVREEEANSANREEIQENPDAAVSPIFQGVHAYRLTNNPDEKAAAQLWEAENLQGAVVNLGDAMVSTWQPSNSLLGRLLSRDPDRGIRPSARDWLVASTVMQWLGTSRGWLFFTQLQMAANQKRGD